MSEMRCHTFQGVHIPGCYGCAVWDHSRCYCTPSRTAAEPDPDAAINRRLARLESQVKALTEARA